MSNNCPRLDNNMHSTSMDESRVEIRTCVELLQRSIEISATRGKNSPEARKAFLKGQVAFEACMRTLRRNFETAPTFLPGAFTSTPPSPSVAPCSYLSQQATGRASLDIDCLPLPAAPVISPWQPMSVNYGIYTPKILANHVRASSEVESNASTSSLADTRWGMGLVHPQACHRVDVTNKIQQLTPPKDAATTLYDEAWIRDLIGKVARHSSLIGSQSMQFSSPFKEMPFDTQAKNRNNSDGAKGDNQSAKAWEAKCSCNEREESDNRSSLSSHHRRWSRTMMNTAENSVESSDDASSTQSMGTDGSTGRSIDGSVSRGSPENSQNYSNSRPSLSQSSFLSFLAKMESIGVITRQIQKKEGAPDLVVGFTVVASKLGDWKELRKEWFMAGKVGQVYRPSSLHQMLRRRGFYPTMKTHRTSHGHDFENSMSCVLDTTSQRRYTQSKASLSPDVAEERRRAPKRRKSTHDT
jgi:hypothetical protein